MDPITLAMLIASSVGAIGTSIYNNRAAKKENDATREYNLKLAQMQNQINVEQWQRENDYNSPTAQVQRLKDAGLNPNLLYGGGVSNMASSSPQMTSGALATPTPLVGMPNSVGDAIMMSKQMEMMDAQIEGIRAQSRKTLADAGLSETALKYADAEKRLGIKLSEQQFESVAKDMEHVQTLINNNREQLNGITLDNMYKAIRNAFESEALQKQCEILAQELNIKKAEAVHAMEYYAARLLGIQAENAWNDAKWIVEQKNGTATAIKYGSEALSDILNNLSKWIPKKRK